jgi:hypothetical protein
MTPVPDFMLNGQRNECFIWKHFLHAHRRPIVVLPSPHGKYKSGISYNDACAAGEIYKKLHSLAELGSHTPETLADDIATDLIVIAGKKANRVAEHLQSRMNESTNFFLEDGVIYDREKQAIVTAQFSKREKRTLDAVTLDYGLVRYSSNPFGQCTKVLQLAGIKGHGTLAAAIVSTKDNYLDTLNRLLQQIPIDAESPELSNRTVEILIRAVVRERKIKSDSLAIQKLLVSDGDTLIWKWESQEYRKIEKVNPHRLDIQVLENRDARGTVPRLWVDGREVQFTKSVDRMRIIHILAHQAKEDYLNESETAGGLSATELAEKMWNIKLTNALAEIPLEIRRPLSSAIVTWARNLQRNGRLRLDESIELDSNYIASEILAFDSDIKKKIVDLVHLINQDARRKLGFRLIESVPSGGYRISIHPALIFENVNAAG